ncbi:hypothetical protein MAP00_005544 [Monascus purpureus]|nr:hypothetical protein MAP00_005544 [Monascus purpureus]
MADVEPTHSLLSRSRATNLSEHVTGYGGYLELAIWTMVLFVGLHIKSSAFIDEALAALTSNRISSALMANPENISIFLRIWKRQRTVNHRGFTRQPESKQLGSHFRLNEIHICWDIPASRRGKGNGRYCCADSLGPISGHPPC